MKITSNPDAKLKAIFESYKRMPNGGAILQVLADGRVSNGMAVITRFNSKSSACRQLRMAGFLPLHGGQGWKIYPFANSLNQ